MIILCSKWADGSSTNESLMLTLIIIIIYNQMDFPMRDKR
jgi:hypothetical protein